MPVDIPLTAENDLDLLGWNANGFTEGDDALVQRCKIALQLHTGEYRQDLSAGVDWLGVFDGTADGPSEIRRVLSSVPGVFSVEVSTFQVDETRNAVVRFVVNDIEVVL